MLQALHIHATGVQAQAAQAVIARLQRAIPLLPRCTWHADTLDDARAARMNLLAAATPHLTFGAHATPLEILNEIHATVLPTAIAQGHVQLARPCAGTASCVDPRVTLWLPFEWQPLVAAAVIESDPDTSFATTIPDGGCWTNCLQLIDVLATLASRDPRIVLEQTRAALPAVCARAAITGVTAAFGGVLPLLHMDAGQAAMTSAAAETPFTHWRSDAHKTAALARASTCAGDVRSAYAQHALSTYHATPATSGEDDPLAHWLPALQVIACAGVALHWWTLPHLFSNATRTTAAPFGCGVDQLMCAMLWHDMHARVLFGLDGAVCGGRAAPRTLDTAPNTSLPPLRYDACTRPRDAYIQFPEHTSPVHLCSSSVLTTDSTSIRNAAARASGWCCTHISATSSQDSTTTTGDFIIFGRDACPFTQKAKAHCAATTHVYYTVPNADAARAHDAFKKLETDVRAAAASHATVPLVFYRKNNHSNYEFVGGYDALLKRFPQL